MMNKERKSHQSKSNVQYSPDVFFTIGITDPENPSQKFSISIPEDIASFLGPESIPVLRETLLNLMPDELSYLIKKNNREYPALLPREVLKKMVEALNLEDFCLIEDFSKQLPEKAKIIKRVHEIENFALTLGISKESADEEIAEFWDYVRVIWGLEPKNYEPIEFENYSEILRAILKKALELYRYQNKKEILEKFQAGAVSDFLNMAKFAAEKETREKLKLNGKYKKHKTFIGFLQWHLKRVGIKRKQHQYEIIGEFLAAAEIWQYTHWNVCGCTDGRENYQTNYVIKYNWVIRNGILVRDYKTETYNAEYPITIQAPGVKLSEDQKKETNNLEAEKKARKYPNRFLFAKATAKALAKKRVFIKCEFWGFDEEKKQFGCCYGTGLCHPKIAMVRTAK